MASERLQRQIERLLDEAEQSIAQRDWAGVREHAQDVISIDPENREGQAFLAAADRALGATSNLASVEQEATAPEPLAVPAAPEAERRQLTVMFCDLQGSTALSQQLDPEQLRDVIRGYQEVCAGAVGRFEGHIAKYLGDGLLVYFGYPQAHEDDPQRAVRAGLAILQDMDPLNALLKSEKDLELVVRIGIHTGLVVAGEMGGGDTLEELAIVGETPNVAARIEGAALPNSVVVSNITAGLVQGFFRYESLGPHELKGISEPVELFRVLEESGAQTRFDVAVSTHLTPLVGREQEVGLLVDRWEQAEEGLGQVVLMSGEAGIGKSRLLQGINDRLEGRAYLRQEYRCSPYRQNSALHPVIEFLERWMNLRREDSPEERLAKIERRLSDYPVQMMDSVPLIAELLSVQVDDRYPPLGLSPELHRRKTLELLVLLVIEAASEQPVLAVFEDLHWADPTTLEMLGLLVNQAATANVLFIFTFRPEFTPPWGSRSHVTQITLNRLPQRLAAEMLARLTGEKELPGEVSTQIASKSDGVPLFVEELTRMVLESDLLDEEDGRYVLRGPLNALAIPSTLQDSLTARLDNLNLGRESVQLASVLGREFDHELIEALSPLDTAALAQDLDHLVSNEFLYQRGVPPEVSYIFKHALVQDAAYNSLLLSRRQQYHRQVAGLLEEQFPETIETQPELLAHHYTEAGLGEPAATYWQVAGDRAISAFAHEEALAHFQRGMAAKGINLEGSESPEDAVAADLFFGMARAKSALFTFRPGYAQEAVANLRSAFEFYAASGEKEKAIAIAQAPIRIQVGERAGLSDVVSQALKMAEPESTEKGQLLAISGWISGLEEGDYPAADRAFKEAMEIARRNGDGRLLQRTLAQAAQVDLYHAKFEEAIEKSGEVLKLSADERDLNTECAARYVYCVSGYWTGKPVGQQDLDAFIATAEKLGNRFWLHFALWASEMGSAMRGDWKSARQFGHRGLSVVPRAQTLLFTMCRTELETGESDRAEEMIQDISTLLAENPVDPTFQYSAVVGAAGLSSWFANTPRTPALSPKFAEVILSSPFAIPLFAAATNAGLAFEALVRKDLEACRSVYTALYPLKDRYIVIADVSRLLANLAHAAGDLPLAVEHFEDSLALCSKGGYLPEYAWACLGYAETLQERDGDGDQTKAASLLHESLAISTELGMGPLMERVQARVNNLRS